ncbi:MAG: helix-turn-helix domain-containing protein [Chloroflexi bacterium]|nr:helix-turn-helix domain-containing protein [Chloroflexota bacterium]
MTDRPAIQTKRVYSREEAAEVLGVSLSTLTRLIAGGHLGAYQPAGMRRVFITGASLLRMLGEETVGASVARAPLSPEMSG